MFENNPNSRKYELSWLRKGANKPIATQRDLKCAEARKVSQIMAVPLLKNLTQQMCA